MDYGLIISVLTGALVSVASGQSRQYYFVNTSLNWTEAQSFCRQVYTDLATIENTADVSAVNSITSNYTGKFSILESSTVLYINHAIILFKLDRSSEILQGELCGSSQVHIRNQTENDIITNLTGGNTVWIGLYREKLWSDGSTSLFRHWASSQPNSRAEECVTTSFSDSGQWSDDKCASSFPFICYKTSNAS
ncbi:layilin-like [Thunnus thynnus]|uniref:layilin-like n=1 Tax=Thunnus thynnus TaxID=8237 RepID=UPI003529B041